MAMLRSMALGFAVLLALPLVAATQDTADAGPAMHGRLAAAVRAAGSAMVRSVTLKDDHAFSASRPDLAELLANWLNEVPQAASGRRAPEPVE